MLKLVQHILTFLSCVYISAGANEPDLPLCPTNVQFLPQNLPMHCRIPTAADLKNIHNMPFPPQGFKFPPFPPQFYQNPPGKLPEQNHMPLPSGLPGPGAMPMPMPMPMSMPMGVPGPSQKLPVIVMPFYSPDTSLKRSMSSNLLADKPRKIRKHKKKQRRPMFSDTDDSSDTDTSLETTDSSDEEGLWRGRRDGRRLNRHHREKRRRHQRHELLTPVLQYVTKEGYVIFEKTISKDEAHDWLKVKDDVTTELPQQDKQEIIEIDDTYELERKTIKEEDNIEYRTEKNASIQHRKKTLKH